MCVKQLLFFLKIKYFQRFLNFLFKEVILNIYFENFNISENNMINVEVVKLLHYFLQIIIKILVTFHYLVIMKLG